MLTTVPVLFACRCLAYSFIFSLLRIMLITPIMSVLVQNALLANARLVCRKLYAHHLSINLILLP